MIKDHQGREFDSVVRMCDFWGVNRHTYATRKYAGLSLEECLDPIARHYCMGFSKPSEDHLGNKFSTIKEMCAHWKAPISSFRRLTRDGWSVKDALEHLKGRSGTGRYDLNAHRLIQSAVENGKLSTAQNARALRDWGFTKEEILPVYKKISLPVFKRVYLTNAEIATRMEEAHICPRVTPAYATNRFNSGLFTLKECALSPRAFLRIVKERFGC